MSTQLISRNNVVAGLFVILSIILAVAIAFILSDVQDKFASRTEYIARFPTSVGVAGLQPGADVTFGGMTVGRVKSIHENMETDPATGMDIVRSHDVVIALSSDLVIYEDAYADLTLPLLGGVSRINIASPGTGAYEGGPEDANPTLDPGEALRGRFAPSILTQLGFTTEEALAIKETIHEVRGISENVGEVSESMKRMAQQLEPEFGKGVDDGRSTMANIRAFTERLNAEDGWAPRVDSILASADDAAKQITPVLDDAKSTIAEAKGMIEENRERVASILENVDVTTERVKSETMDQVDEMLEKGTLALGSYQDVALNANSILLNNKPKIAATLDSASDIGVQGKLFVEELRAQPWRLLKKPSEEDLLREPIYEAARSYARAVSDLRVASEALDAAVLNAASNPNPDAVEQIRDIAEVVDKAYGRYSDAEKALLERLRAGSPTTTP
ncbi:MAG: MCE family protein [Phycisphaerales bacterium]|nr:MCE family protein [Phycisphaerales bacterium]